MKSLIRETCTGQWLELLNRESKKITVKAKENIFNAGDTALGIYEIISGKIKVTAKDSTGTESLVRLAGDNDILGHRGVGGDWIYRVTATALEDTKLLFIPRYTFELLAKNNPEFSYRLMTLFAEDLRHSEEKTMHLPVVNRVANAILMNCEAFGMNNKTGKLNYTISRQDYANRAVTTYESTIRAIADLKQSGIIDTDNKTILVKDFDRLKKIALTAESA